MCSLLLGGISDAEYEYRLWTGLKWTAFRLHTAAYAIWDFMCSLSGFCWVCCVRNVHNSITVVGFCVVLSPTKKNALLYEHSEPCPRKSGFNTSSITRSRMFGSRSRSLITEIHSQTARKKLSLHKVGISIVCIVCKFPDSLILNSFISQLSRFDYS